MSLTAIDRFAFAIVLGEEIRKFCLRAQTGEAFSSYRAAKLAEQLCGAARRLHKLYCAGDDGCGNFRDQAEQTRHDDKEERAKNRIARLVKPYSITPLFGGDPRGAAVQLVLPLTKRTNGWGGEGYCVPQ